MSDKPKTKTPAVQNNAADGRPAGAAPAQGLPKTAAQIKAETAAAIKALRDKAAEELKTADPRKGVLASIPLDLHAKWVAHVGKDRTQSDVLEELIRKAVG